MKSTLILLLSLTALLSGIHRASAAGYQMARPITAVTSENIPNTYFFQMNYEYFAVDAGYEAWSVPARTHGCVRVDTDTEKGSHVPHVHNGRPAFTLALSFSSVAVPLAPPIPGYQWAQPSGANKGVTICKQVLADSVPNTESANWWFGVYNNAPDDTSQLNFHVIGGFMVELGVADGPKSLDPFGPTYSDRRKFVKIVADTNTISLRFRLSKTATERWLIPRLVKDPLEIRYEFDQWAINSMESRTGVGYYGYFTDQDNPTKVGTIPADYLVADGGKYVAYITIEQSMTSGMDTMEMQVTNEHLHVLQDNVASTSTLHAAASSYFQYEIPHSKNGWPIYLKLKKQAGEEMKKASIFPSDHPFTGYSSMPTWDTALQQEIQLTILPGQHNYPASGEGSLYFRVDGGQNNNETFEFTIYAVPIIEVESGEGIVATLNDDMSQYFVVNASAYSMDNDNPPFKAVYHQSGGPNVQMTVGKDLKSVGCFICAQTGDFNFDMTPQNGNWADWVASSGRVFVTMKLASYPGPGATARLNITALPKIHVSDGGSAAFFVNPDPQWDAGSQVLANFEFDYDSTVSWPALIHMRLNRVNDTSLSLYYTTAEAYARSDGSPVSESDCISNICAWRLYSNGFTMGQKLKFILTTNGPAAPGMMSISIGSSKVQTNLMINDVTDVASDNRMLEFGEMIYYHITWLPNILTAVTTPLVLHVGSGLENGRMVLTDQPEPKDGCEPTGQCVQSFDGYDYIENTQYLFSDGSGSISNLYNAMAATPANRKFTMMYRNTAPAPFSPFSFTWGIVQHVEISIGSTLIDVLTVGNNYKAYNVTGFTLTNSINALLVSHNGTLGGLKMILGNDPYPPLSASNSLQLSNDATSGFITVKPSDLDATKDVFVVLIYPMRLAAEIFFNLTVSEATPIPGNLTGIGQCVTFTDLYYSGEIKYFDVAATQYPSASLLIRVKVDGLITNSMDVIVSSQSVTPDCFSMCAGDNPCACQGGDGIVTPTQKSHPHHTGATLGGHVGVGVKKTQFNPSGYVTLEVCYPPMVEMSNNVTYDLAIIGVDIMTMMRYVSFDIETEVLALGAPVEFIFDRLNTPENLVLTATADEPYPNPSSGDDDWKLTVGDNNERVDSVEMNMLNADDFYGAKKIYGTVVMQSSPYQMGLYLNYTIRARAIEPTNVQVGVPQQSKEVQTGQVIIYSIPLAESAGNAITVSVQKGPSYASCTMAPSAQYGVFGSLDYTGPGHLNYTWRSHYGGTVNAVSFTVYPDDPAMQSVPAMYVGVQPMVVMGNKCRWTISTLFVSSISLASGVPVDGSMSSGSGAFYDVTVPAGYHVRLRLKLDNIDVDDVTMMGCSTAFCRNETAQYFWTSESATEDDAIVGDAYNVGTGNLHIGILSKSSVPIANFTITAWVIPTVDLSAGVPVSASIAAGSHDMVFYRYRSVGCTPPLKAYFNVNSTVPIQMAASDSIPLPRIELRGSAKTASVSPVLHKIMDASAPSSCEIYIGIATRSGASFTLTAAEGTAPIVPHVGNRGWSLRVSNESGNPGLVTNPGEPKLGPNMRNSFTVRAWFRINAENPKQRIYGPPSDCVLVGYNPDLDLPWSIFWQSDEKEELCFRLYQSGLARTDVICADGAYADGEWHHVAAVRNTSAEGYGEMILNIDGVRVAFKGNTQNSQMGQGDTAMHYFARCLGGESHEYFDGWIDEISFWSVAQSDADIQATYKQRTYHTQPNLLALLTFDEHYIKDDVPGVNKLTVSKSGDALGTYMDNQATAPTDANTISSTIEDMDMAFELSGWKAGMVAIDAAEIISLPSSGVLVDPLTDTYITAVPHLLCNQTVVYRPEPNIHSASQDAPLTSFNYRVKDVDGEYSGVGIFKVIVLAKNDAPVVTNLAGTITIGDRTRVIHPAFNFTDDAIHTSAAELEATISLDSSMSHKVSILATAGVTGNPGDPTIPNNSEVKFKGNLVALQSAVSRVRFQARGGKDETVRVRLTVFDHGDTDHTGGMGYLSGFGDILVDVHSRSSAAETIIYGSGLNVGIANQNVETFIQTRDIYGNNRTSTNDGETWAVTVSGPDTATPVPSSFDPPKGRYQLSWVTQIAGTYTVEVKLSPDGVVAQSLIGSNHGQPSSHTVVVSPADPDADVNGVYCHLPELNVHEEDENYMYFTSRDKFGNLRSQGGDSAVFQLTIKLSNVPCLTHCSIGSTIDFLNGTYGIPFNITNGETYSIGVTVNGNAAAGPGCSQNIRVAKSCVAGTYPIQYAGGCNPCEGGTASNSTLVFPYYDNLLTVKCPPCLPGTYNVDPAVGASGATACMPCPLGQYTDQSGQVGCTGCTNTEYQDVTGQTACKPCTANSKSFVGATQQTDCSCNVGYYRTTQATCIVCPGGASCAGGASAPVARPGFYPASSVNFVECSPKSACLGGGTTKSCNTGYMGRLCGECESGYYKLGGLCNECPNNSLVIMLVILIGAFVFMGIMIKLQTMGLSFASITIMVSFMQLTTMFARFNLDWPDIVLEFFNILSLFNLNIDIAAPECTIPLSYYEKLILKLLMPFGVMFVMALFTVGLGILEFIFELTPMGKKKIKKRAIAAAKAEAERNQAIKESDAEGGVRQPAALADTVAPVKKSAYAVTLDDPNNLDLKPFKLAGMKKLLNYATNGGVQIIVILYVFVTSTSLDFFNCIPVGTDSNRLMLASQPTLDCYTPEWLSYQPIALVAVVGYAVGIPIIALAILYKIRTHLREKKTNERFGGLFKKYSTRRWYWEVVIMFRKLSIIAAAMFATEIIIQSVIGIGFIFVFLLAHTFSRPYKDKQHNVIEFIGLVANTLTLFAGILFYSGKLSTTTSLIVTWITIIAVIISGVAFTIQFIAESGKAYKILKSRRFRKLMRSASQRFRRSKSTKAIEFFELLSPDEKLLIDNVLPSAEMHLHELNGDERQAVMKLLRAIDK